MQSYFDIEIIIIDDKSTDNSKDIILNMQRLNENIIFISNEINLGLTKSINRCINSTRGQYILVLGQDDILRPNHVEIMLKNMSESVSFVFCQSDIIDSTGSIVKLNKSSNNNSVDLYKLSKNNCINSCGLIMNKKHLVEANGYPELTEYPNYGEWLLWIKLASKGTIVFEENINSLYRRHDSNLSNTFSNIKTKKNLFRYYKICRKYALKLGKFKTNKIIILYLNFCIESLFVLLSILNTFMKDLIRRQYDKHAN